MLVQRGAPRMSYDKPARLMVDNGRQYVVAAARGGGRKSEGGGAQTTTLGSCHQGARGHAWYQPDRDLSALEHHRRRRGLRNGPGRLQSTRYRRAPASKGQCGEAARNQAGRADTFSPIAGLEYGRGPAPHPVCHRQSYLPRGCAGVASVNTWHQGARKGARPTVHQPSTSQQLAPPAGSEVALLSAGWAYPQKDGGDYGVLPRDHHQARENPGSRYQTYPPGPMVIGANHACMFDVVGRQGGLDHCKGAGTRIYQGRRHSQNAPPQMHEASLATKDRETAPDRGGGEGDEGRRRCAKSRPPYSHAQAANAVETEAGGGCGAHLSRRSRKHPLSLARGRSLRGGRKACAALLRQGASERPALLYGPLRQSVSGSPGIPQTDLPKARGAVRQKSGAVYKTAPSKCEGKRKGTQRKARSA